MIFMAPSDQAVTKEPDVVPSALSDVQQCKGRRLEQADRQSEYPISPETFYARPEEPKS
jgi:hypothetical protein